MNAEEKLLRKFIRETIEDVIDEISTTGMVAGYETPFAFTNDEDEDEVEKKKLRNTPGYTKVADIDETIQEIDSLLKVAYKDFPELMEGRHSYTRFRDEEEHSTNRHKLACAVRDAKQSMKEMKKRLKHAKRFKNEMEISTDNYWKRTHQNINRIVKEMEGILTIVKELRDETDGDPTT